jgi:dTMP kinase
MAEALLFAAARAELLARIVRPRLAEGDIVLMDRYLESSIAYQGYGAQVGAKTVAALNRIATGGLLPRLTLLFSGRGFSDEPKDRIEGRSLAFRDRVRAGYAHLADEFAHIQIVEADKPPEDVAAHIRRIVEPYLEPKGEARG